MKRNISIYLFATFFIIFCFVSCSKDEKVSVPISGNLSGTIQTFDDKITSTNDLAGVTITLTNFSNQTATTDAQGKFSFPNLTYDEYDLEVSKVGYGTLKIFGITHAYNASASVQGSTFIPSITFGKKSTTTVTALAVNGNNIFGEPGVTFSFAITPVPTPASKAFVRYFLSTTSDVSSTKYMAASTVVNFSNLSAITGFSSSQLLGLGFTSGQTVYVKMYGESFITNEYYQPNLGYKIFPNLNLSSPAAVSFVVP